LDEIIWALQNVSFTVNQGEVVGIIGRNGAGKSTLLKILSRITEPTSGEALILGRVGSLLEVGTGFHHELTGRENVFLNGAILGMKRTEINRKFDEIVAFSEVEKFIDTPVKHYSSGMQMRLAFAVAAHLEPEILIVDEVLAVGDARFQRKCLNKMQSVGEEGRTVLFVSHNMPAVTRLCERVILLDGGQILEDGPAHLAVSAYLNSGRGVSSERLWPNANKAPGGPVSRLCAVRVVSEAGQVVDSIDIRHPVGVEMEFEALQPGHILMPHFHFNNEDGTCLFGAHDVDPNWRLRPRPVGRYKSVVWLPGNLLAEGTIFVNAGVITIDPDIPQFYEREAVAFQVIDTMEPDSARGDWKKNMNGVVRPLLKWATEFTPNGNGSVKSSEKLKAHH
ncbi:MAG: ABC transporter ATP-binding protein, partial [Anaerolineae bacterium]|nr:ABC transporter ATP-binding protein [Anaerolineae bacterium]